MSIIQVVEDAFEDLQKAGLSTDKGVVKFPETPSETEREALEAKVFAECQEEGLDY